ncbi:MAG TPA: hypothetical protein VGC65_02970 [Bacteroidia bacterium]
MKKLFFLLFLLSGMLVPNGYSTEPRKQLLPVSVFSLQYAGSTGFMTGGYFRSTRNAKLQTGLLYGYTPEYFGGVLHTLSLKALYNPFKIKLNEAFFVEPVQVGAFLCQNFGEDLDPTWSSTYPKGYYWWTPSLRGHVFISSAVSLRSPNSSLLDHTSFYFEANTNDLYLSSYLVRKNYSSLSLYDIVFFGMGLKFYLRHE